MRRAWKNFHACRKTIMDTSFVWYAAYQFDDLIRSCTVLICFTNSEKGHTSHACFPPASFSIPLAGSPGLDHSNPAIQSAAGIRDRKWQRRDRSCPGLTPTFLAGLTSEGCCEHQVIQPLLRINPKPKLVPQEPQSLAPLKLVLQSSLSSLYVRRAASNLQRSTLFATKLI